MPKLPKKLAAPKKKAATRKAAPKKAVLDLLAARPAKTGRTPKKPAKAELKIDATVLDSLFATVTERRAFDPALSHSARLLSRGVPKVAQKFGEEAVECLIEAVAGNRAELVAESADVLYHLIVMWVAAGVVPGQVWEELRRREGMSGIEEKAARVLAVGTRKIP